MIRYARILAVLAVLVPHPAHAQTVDLDTRGTSGTITGNGQFVTLTNTGSMATLGIQTVGTVTGLTWELQCSGDGTTFDQDDEIPVTLVSSAPTPADAITSNAEALYTASIAGCVAVRIASTAYSSGSLTFTLTAITSGGGSSGGGGAASSVSIAQGGNTAAVNASSQLSVNCGNCTGAGSSDIEGSTFTLGTDTVAPLGGYVDETTPTAATEDRMSVARLTLQRGLHVNPRDAAGSQLLGTAAALANTTSNPTLGGLAAFQMIFNGTTWDRWTGLVSLAANQSVNVAQINGVTTLMGNGASGTGAQRVTLANDSTGVLATVSTVTTVGTVSAVTPLGTAAAAADATANPTLGGVRDFSHIWNGTTWDRTPGAAATGLLANTELPAAAALANATSNPTVPAVGAFLMGWNGATWDRVTPSVDATHGGTISATGPQIMGEATTGLTSDTAVSDNQPTRFKTDTLGRQITVPGCGTNDRVRGYLANTDGASTSVLAAQGAGIIAEIWTVILSNSSATALTVDLRDGTAGSVLATFTAPAGGGSVNNLNSPILFTANTAVAVDGSAAATTLYTTVLGCKVK